MVDGVAQVNVFGAAKYAVRIQLDPKALATRTIGIDEVADGVAAGNVNLPTGILWGPHRAYTVQARSEEHTSELQSQSNLVCRLLLEKKKNRQNRTTRRIT